MKNIAFIGGGNMASAIVQGMLKSGNYKAGNIMVSDRNEPKRNYFKSLGVATTNSNIGAARFADVVILTVKPKSYGEVIQEIKSYATNKLIITVAAGITTEYMEKTFCHPVRVIRTMPNTPAAVGAGMTALCPNPFATSGDLAFATNLFESIGVVERIEESQFDVASAVAGSSPALVYQFIEALADGAVLKGMSRNKAYSMASQAVLGSAKMVLETGLHPAELKDNVTSPAGTTIEAVRHLENSAFRGAVIEAVAKCVQKSEKMTK